MCVYDDLMFNVMILLGLVFGNVWVLYVEREDVVWASRELAEFVDVRATVMRSGMLCVVDVCFFVLGDIVMFMFGCVVFVDCVLCGL